MALTNHLYEYGNADLLAQVMHLRKEVNERDVFIEAVLENVEGVAPAAGRALRQAAPTPHHYEVS